jgi:muramoyltetrapeptide carboxypeptidase
MVAPEPSPATPVRPPRLAAGARVALVAPSGPLRGPADVERAVANVRAFGWEPVIGAHVLCGDGYLAGTDDERWGDLAAALADPTIDAIWCLRGGYGAMRLLPRLDLAQVRARPRTLIGFSDITALHAAWQRAGVVSYHGPVAREVLPPLSRQSLGAAVATFAEPAGEAPTATILRGGTATGRLAGGNLALVAALAGTPWALSFDGAIAVFEDVGEATYRVDRLLMQLRLADAFRGCRGLVFGHFTERRDGDGSRPLMAVLGELANALRIPAIVEAPVGHLEAQWTLPLGLPATLVADACALRVHGEPERRA